MNSSELEAQIKKLRSERDRLFRELTENEGALAECLRLHAEEVAREEIEANLTRDER